MPDALEAKTVVNAEMLRKAASMVRYDAETGNLVWVGTYPQQQAGATATRSNLKKGYRFLLVSIDGARRQILAHRLIWFIVTGTAPMLIDHINRDRSDNRWENLREVSPLENARNRSMHRSNTSGATGVCWNKAAQSWFASGRIGPKKVHLGSFKDKDEAISAANEFRNGLGYTAGHGEAKSPYQDRIKHAE